MSFSEVRRWTPGALHDLVGQLNTEYNELVGTSDELDASAAPADWTGDASDAAANRRGQLVDQCQEWAAEIAAVRRGVGDVADAVTGVQNAVREIDSLADAQEFVVNDRDQVVSVYSGEHPIPKDIQAERDRTKAELEDRVEQCLRQADDLDADLAKVLWTAAAGNTVDAEGDSTSPSSLGAWGGSGAAAGSLSIVAPPPVGASPTDNAAWWAALSKAQREKLIQTNPEMVGNRDGVLAKDRSKANLELVKQERTTLQSQAGSLRDKIAASQGPGGFAQQAVLKNELERVEAKLRSLDTIDQIMLDRHGNVVNGKQLMSLDMTGNQAKAAIVNGDADSADHVAVFTPGMNSTVDGSMAGYVNDTDDLRLHAQDELDREGRSGETVATVTWLGYEPPKTDDSSTYLDIVTGDEAEDGGQKLAKFYNGIDAARPTDPHMTALGHSYGSLTTGIALRDNMTGVDDAGFFGSPGIGVDSASELKVPEGHTFAWEAREDFVADIPDLTENFGKDPADMEGVHHLSTEEYTPPGEDREPTAASTGHSEYLRKDDAYQTSEYGMSRVIIGSPDLRPNPAG